MADSTIKFCSYDPKWAQDYLYDSQRLQGILGNVIMQINHIGSTSISHIKSKPIIDISIESDVFPPSEVAVDALGSVGYVNCGEAGIPGRIWFTKGAPRKFNLHWCPINGVVARSQVAFRDKLMVDIKLAREYEQLKIEAARGKDIDSSSYAKAKTKFVTWVLSQ